GLVIPAKAGIQGLKTVERKSRDSRLRGNDMLISPKVTSGHFTSMLAVVTLPTFRRPGPR
ncbi:MAG: hypothetical protein LH470_10380, partial [Lysobacter sp.]|nr:hypothetical protein [Lysobacter sp.]